MRKQSKTAIGMIAAAVVGTFTLAGSVSAAVVTPGTPQPTVWFNGDAITGVAEGATFAAWPDSSGNNINTFQNDLVRRPTFRAGVANGHAVARFNTAGQSTTAFLSFRAAPSQPLARTAASKLTVFVVSNDTGARSGTNTRGTLLSTNSALNVSDGFGLVHNVNPTTAGYAHYGRTATPGGGVQTAAVTAAEDDFNLIRLTRDGLNSELSMFGDVTATTTNAVWNGFNVSTLARGTDIGTQAGGSFFFGDIAEIIAYDEAALSEADKVAITNYLGNKYAITQASLAVVVPEPATLAALGLAGLIVRRRRTV